MLTNDFQVTTVLYYIVFLPGIALHELTLWLAAGVLNVRAEGALQFPEEQDIGELRLSLVRLSSDTSRVKLIPILLCPLATGLAALWAISAALFPGNALVTLAMPGSVNELIAALRSMTNTADFWLWLYIAFTVANRAFPTLPVKLSRRWKSLSLLALLALCFALWRVFDATNPTIALGIEGLLSGLTLIFAQVLLLNIACVLALGAIEAVIERFSNRSATFRDGKMITLAGGETATDHARQKSVRQRTAEVPKPRPSAPATSIYDLKLPIPGPPGREPVSRQAVAVVTPAAAAERDRDSDQALAARPNTAASAQQLPNADTENARNLASPKEDQSARAKTRPDAPVSSDERQQYNSVIENIYAADGTHFAAAPFARPFAEPDISGSARDDWRESPGDSGGEPFARPFVFSTRADQPATASDLSDAERDSTETDAAATDSKSLSGAATASRARSGSGARHTRPAPKPSQKAASKSGAPEQPANDELQYEDLDDIDAVDPDDGRYDDAL